MSSKVIKIVLISFIVSTSFAMKVNNDAVADKGINFVKTIDNQISGYLRALRRSSQSDFDALQLTVFMNQTANIEKKLDILIAETRRNNRLLSMQMKSSKKLIEIMGEAGSLVTNNPRKEG